MKLYGGNVDDATRHEMFRKYLIESNASLMYSSTSNTFCGIVVHGRKKSLKQHNFVAQTCG